MQFASGSNIDKFITVSDTKRVALEAYLVFCYSGYVPISAIGQVTTSSHVFTNVVTTNLRYIFTKFSLFFRELQSVLFC